MNKQQTMTSLVLALTILLVVLLLPIINTTDTGSLQGTETRFGTRENSKYPMCSIDTPEQLQASEYSTIYDVLQAINEEDEDLFAHLEKCGGHCIRPL